MKIGIQTWGSDGDVLPFMALAAGLQKQGHDVTIAYTSVDNKDYTAYSKQGGFQSFKAFDYFPVSLSEALPQIIAANDPMKQFMLIMNGFFNPAVEAMYKASHLLCVGNDLVIGHMMNHTLLTAAEKFNRPRVSVALSPLAIRTCYVPLFGPNLGRWWNGLTWKLGDYVSLKKLFHQAEKIREREGLPALQSPQKQIYISNYLTLVAASPTLCESMPDWENSVHLCGELNFLLAENPILMPEGMETFLDAGTPPVYMTFGSLTSVANAQTDALVLEAIEKVKCRAIIQSDIQHESTADIFWCNRAPHAAVFPHCAAVIHHGGAGTTHSALRAGCPAIVVEHAFDQMFWGKTLQNAGVAGPILHRNRLTSGQLAEAMVQTLQNQAIKAQARLMGQKMQNENGVKRAIELIEQRYARK